MPSSPENAPMSSPRRVDRGWLVLAGVVVSAATVAGYGVKELRAEDGAAVMEFDVDEDYLSDLQEGILGTDPGLKDTDGDGIDDLEEVARGSDPLDILDVPQSDVYDIAVMGRSVDESLVISTLFYVPNSDFTALDFEIGVRLDGVGLLGLPLQVFLAGSTVTFLSASTDESSALILLETPYPAATASALGSVSFYATITAPGGTEPTEADVINVLDVGGALTAVKFDPTGGGSIYTPLGETIIPPENASSGMTCAQGTAPQGSAGAVVTHLVETSSCEPAETTCSNGCAALAGTTIEVVDPAILIGG